jgi:hypothetical protein
MTGECSSSAGFVVHCQRRRDVAEKLGVGLFSHNVWPIYIAHFRGHWTVFSKVKLYECTALPSMCLYQPVLGTVQYSISHAHVRTHTHTRRHTHIARMIALCNSSSFFLTFLSSCHDSISKSGQFFFHCCIVHSEI